MEFLAWQNITDSNRPLGAAEKLSASQEGMQSIVSYGTNWDHIQDPVDTNPV
jgi:hypothetical protein